MAFTQTPDSDWIRDSQLRGTLKGEAVQVDGGQCECPNPKCKAYNGNLLKHVRLKKDSEVFFDKPCRECGAVITYSAIHEAAEEETCRVVVTARSFLIVKDEKARKRA